MVGHSKENIQNELVSSLYREDKLTELLAETGDIAARRNNCDEMRTLLQRALEIVNEVRDFNTFK
jgi:dynamin 1-like protein